MPGNLNARELDAACGPRSVGSATARLAYAMSNSLIRRRCVLLFAMAGGMGLFRGSPSAHQWRRYGRRAAGMGKRAPSSRAASGARNTGDAALPELLPTTNAVARRTPCHWRSRWRWLPAGRSAPASLSCVQFYMATSPSPVPLASAPAQLAHPLHNSVHNAAAGYWTIGADCAPYTAITARPPAALDLEAAHKTSAAARTSCSCL
jgi:hypothetical protein